MGKLIRLELFSTSLWLWNECAALLTFLRADFKSYKGHHTLLFGDAYFTSIIGPNGSGKSNSYVSIPMLRRGVLMLTTLEWMPSRSS